MSNYKHRSDDREEFSSPLESALSTYIAVLGDLPGKQDFIGILESTVREKLEQQADELGPTDLAREVYNLADRMLVSWISKYRTEEEWQKKKRSWMPESWRNLEYNRRKSIIYSRYGQAIEETLDSFEPLYKSEDYRVKLGYYIITNLANLSHEEISNQEVVLEKILEAIRVFFKQKTVEALWPVLHRKSQH